MNPMNTIKYLERKVAEADDEVMRTGAAEDHAREAWNLARKAHGEAVARAFGVYREYRVARRERIDSLRATEGHPYGNYNPETGS